MINNRIYNRMNKTKTASNMTILDELKTLNTATLIRNVIELAEWFYDRNNEIYEERTLEEFVEFLPKQDEDIMDIMVDILPDSITDEQIDNLAMDNNQLEAIGEYLVEISYNEIEKLYDELDEENRGDSNPGDVRDSDFI